MKIVEYLEQNEINLSMHTCEQCKLAGVVFRNLKPGFILVSDAAKNEMEIALRKHGYWMNKIIDTPFQKSWYEIGKIGEQPKGANDDPTP